jgi:hypothetical protein
MSLACRPAVRASSFLASERSPAALSMGVVVYNRPIVSPCPLLAVGVSVHVLRALQTPADAWCELRHPSTGQSCVVQLCLAPNAASVLHVSPFVAFQLGLDLHPSSVFVLPCPAAPWPVATQVTLSPVVNPNAKLTSHPRYQTRLDALALRRAISTCQVFSNGTFDLSTARPRHGFC